jgi:prepilin-type N-terminal cleavage/methylation domain-containing protein
MKCESRSGFTAVELIIALSIGAILAVMVSPTVFQSLRRGNINKAAAQITDVASRAQQLAIATNGTAGTGELYGVLIRQAGPGAAAIVSLVRGNPSSSPTVAMILLDGHGQPQAQEQLPASARIWSSGVPLVDSGGSLGWYYQNRIGHPVVPGSPGVPGAVGVAPVTVSNAWGISGYTVSLPVIAPGSGNEPGLQVRSPDQGYQVGVVVYPSGAYDTAPTKGN